MQRKKLCNLDRTPDTGHGVWNDAKGAFKKAKEYKHVTLMCATWGVIHGPFGSDSRFQEVRAVVDHFCQTCKDPRQSPYFMASVPRMALDEDDPSIFCVPDLAEEMLRRFKADNPFKIKGSCKMSFNRFMSACKKRARRDATMEQGVLRDWIGMPQARLFQRCQIQEDCHWCR